MIEVRNVDLHKDGSARQGIQLCPVASDSLRPRALQPIRLLCPWDFPGKDIGVGAISFSRGSSQPRIE